MVGDSEEEMGEESYINQFQRNFIPDCLCKAKTTRRINKVINKSALSACVKLKVFSLLVCKGME